MLLLSFQQWWVAHHVLLQALGHRHHHCGCQVDLLLPGLSQGGFCHGQGTGRQARKSHGRSEEQEMGQHCNHILRFLGRICLGFFGDPRFGMHNIHNFHHVQTCLKPLYPGNKQPPSRTSAQASFWPSGSLQHVQRAAGTPRSWEEADVGSNGGSRKVKIRPDKLHKKTRWEAT